MFGFHDKCDQNFYCNEKYREKLKFIDKTKIKVAVDILNGYLTKISLK